MKPSRLIVVAHNVRSLRNVGTLFRTCDGAGVDELVLSGYTGTPPDRRIDKVALDSVDMVPWRHAPEPEDLDAALSDRFVIVLDQETTSVTLQELVIPPGRDVVIVACEELQGAQADVLKHADVLLELPMRGGKTSLNVAMAAGIAMYAVADQLWGTAPSDLTSRQDRPPIRDGVLTRGVTRGEERSTPLPEPRLGTKLE
ncbi:MAG: TrmH family methyltransferase [Thermoleophilia bacterium]|nr:TrmH family methyltransferase [Thermoleophilia bacterium]